MVNCNWCNRSLEDEPPSLKSVLTVLNFCGLPTNQVDHRLYIDTQTSLLVSQREEALGQHLKHSRPKNMDSFIRGRQNTLHDFTTLLANLCISCMLWSEANLNHITPLLLGGSDKKHQKSYPNLPSSPGTRNTKGVVLK